MDAKKIMPSNMMNLVMVYMYEEAGFMGGCSEGRVAERG